MGRKAAAMMTSDAILETMVERIVGQFSPSRVVLFGSRARGTNSEESDFDLLVVMPETADRRKAAIAMRSCLSDLPAAKDVLVTTQEAIDWKGHVVGTVLNAALREGVVLYEAPLPPGPKETKRPMEGPDPVVTEALRWLRYGEEDLSVAGKLFGMEPPTSRHVCWYSRQAAEKAIKGALTLEQVDFPYTHDMEKLRVLLPGGWEIRSGPPSLAELSGWANEPRYPGDWSEPNEDDAVRAEAQARAVYDSVAAEFRRRGAAPEV